MITQEEIEVERFRTLLKMTTLTESITNDPEIKYGSEALDLALAVEYYFWLDDQEDKLKSIEQYNQTHRAFGG